MIIELTRLPVAREGAAAFEQGWLAAAAVLRRQPGYLTHRIGRMVENDEVFLLEIEWETLEAHTEAFTRSADFNTFVDHLVPHLSGAAEVTHFRPSGCATA